METGIRSNVAARTPRRRAARCHRQPDPPPPRRRGGHSTARARRRTGRRWWPRSVRCKASRHVIGDSRSRPSRRSVAEGHNWSSAALAPYTLTSATLRARPGRAHAGPAQGRRTASPSLINGEPEDLHRQRHRPPARRSRLLRRPRRRPARPAIRPLRRRRRTGCPRHRRRRRSRTGSRRSTARLTVRTGIDRGLAEHPDAESQRTALIAIAGSFGGIAAMTMMFVVASTLALSAQHRAARVRPAPRHRHHARPGAPDDPRRGPARVAAGRRAGCLPGIFLGRFLFDQLGSHGVASPYVEFSQGWIPFAAGAGAAVLAAIGAALIAARKSAKIRPVEALIEASLQRKWFGWVRLLFGLLFLGGGLALLIVTATVMTGPLAGATAGPSILCWAIGVALLGPFWTKAVLAVWRWPVQALTRVNGRLAILNVTARSVAMSAAVMPVMLAVGISTANLYMQTTQVHAAVRGVHAGPAGGRRTGLPRPACRPRCCPRCGGARGGERFGVRPQHRRRSTNRATRPSTRTALPVLGVDAQGRRYGASPVDVRITGRPDRIDRGLARVRGSQDRSRCRLDDHHDARRRDPGEAAGGRDCSRPSVATRRSSCPLRWSQRTPRTA